jgi:hypothetical protein
MSTAFAATITHLLRKAFFDDGVFSYLMTHERLQPAAHGGERAAWHTKRSLN